MPCLKFSTGCAPFPTKLVKNVDFSLLDRAVPIRNLNSEKVVIHENGNDEKASFLFVLPSRLQVPGLTTSLTHSEPTNRGSSFHK